MQMYFVLTIFIFGLIVGSFLNVVIYWLEKEVREKRKEKKVRESLTGRSFCPRCGHKLSFWDLIPLFSWIFLGARCRYCGEKISIQYPLVELSTALIFLATFFYIRNEIFSAIGYWLLAIVITKLVLLITLNSLLLTTFVYDLKHKIIPDKVILPAILIVVSYWLLVVSGGYLAGRSVFLITNLYPLISAFVAGGFFYLLAAVSDGKWMGGGDIKLAFLMGLLLGFPNILVALFLGFFLGAVFGIFLMILGKKGMKSEIPFGPFLITGTWIALFWGERVVQLYLRAFM